MKIVNPCLMTIGLLTSCLITRAQDADSLLNKYIDAIGGKDKISSVTSVITQATTDVMGNENNTTVTLLNGKGYRSESDNNGQKYIQCFNDKGGWMVNPYSGSSDPQPMSADQYKDGKIAMDFGGELFDATSKGNKIEWEGTEKIGQAETYKLKVTTPEGVALTYYLDSATDYVVRMVSPGDMMGQPIDLIFNFSDYKKTDYGLMMPFKTEVEYGDQFSLTIQVKQIDFNKPVDPSIFDMPKS